MRYFSINLPPTDEAVRIFAQKRGIIEHLDEGIDHPQEDWLAVADNPPVLAVADGVTLRVEELIKQGREYPNPSPAGEVARIFCESVVRSASDKYSSLSEPSLRTIFTEANQAVADYNGQIGTTELAGNPTNLYAATGAFAVIKDHKAYWATICDSFFAHFDQEMSFKFMSSGVCEPYAVVNGEQRMADYLEQGVAEFEPGDRVFVFTDGFVDYFELPEFKSLFKNWPDDLNQAVTDFSHKMNIQDPYKYGRERTLAALLVV